jgi:hypothetical protein
MKLSSLTPGQTVQAGYCAWSTPCIFQGFAVKHDGEIRWNTLKEFKEAFQVTNLKDLEQAVEATALGAYAVFSEGPEGDTWAAYLWRGCFRVGSSADRLQLTPA